MILRILFALTLLSLLTVFPAAAQSVEPAVVNASGGFSATSTHSFEYSVGQLIPSGVQAPLTPGVHQPAWNVGLEKTAKTDSKVSVYPSPMESVLYLKPDWKAGETLYYTLFDASGKTILKRDVRLTNGNERQEIEVTSLAAGNYILEVASGNNPANKVRFKLQKLR